MTPIEDPKHLEHKALRRLAYDALALIAEVKPMREGKLYAIDPAHLGKLRVAVSRWARIDQALHPEEWARKRG